MIYKFKSLSRIDYIFELISKGEIYCADYKELNDPFEGQFIYSCKNVLYGEGLLGENIYTNPNIEKNEIMKSVGAVFKSDNIRICSFSKDYKDVRLWAYYADSHKGICIEISPSEVMMNDLYEVKYEDCNMKKYTEVKDDTVVKELLSRKTQNWEFESEIRLISDKSKYSIEGYITKIIFGYRMEKIYKDMIINMSGNIPLYQAYLKNDFNIEIKEYK